jgi:hypothetical protein
MILSILGRFSFIVGRKSVIPPDIAVSPLLLALMFDMRMWPPVTKLRSTDRRRAGSRLDVSTWVRGDVGKSAASKSVLLLLMFILMSLDE